MCGLSGELRFDGQVADVAAVRRMTAALARRGPDGCGLYQQGPLALGHQRLKIIDLSEHGSQPIVDSALGLTAVFNGCIYNYQELRTELTSAGYQFFSTSDTEVILKAYHRWGTSFVEHFAGMFAIAIWERDSGRLILARDRLGIKPLYVSSTPARLRFASSLPAILAGGDVDTSIDPVALHHYLTFHSVVPAPHTVLTGVRKLPPATVRVIEPDGTSKDTLYWSASFTRQPEHAAWSAEDWQDALLDSLRTAVRRRMVADVPVGVLLSGGLDSSLVVALLAEQGQDLTTFSIGFESAGGESGDEFFYSDIIAKHFGSRHEQIMVPTPELLPALGETLHAQSEPMVSHDNVAFFLLSQVVARHVKVVQSGQGADEVLAGYDWYPPLAGVAREDALDAYSTVFFDRSSAGVGALLHPERRAAGDPSREFIAEHFAAPGAQTAVDAALRVDTQIMLVDDPVKRVDNMTMAWGLEARVPFLDHELVELAPAACPPELKLASGGKGVLKDASRKLLPVDVIDRPKGYFPVPAIRHLSGPLLERVREALLGPVGRGRQLFDPAAVEGLLADPNGNRTPLGSNSLWQVAVLEMWLQDQGVS